MKSSTYNATDARDDSPLELDHGMLSATPTANWGFEPSNAPLGALEMACSQSSFTVSSSAYMGAADSVAPGNNLMLQVVRIAPTVEKKRYDGSISRIAEAVLADETGCVTFTARNGQIDKLEVGLVVVVRNSNADIFNGFMRLNVTQWGKMTQHPDGLASTPPPPPSVNTANDISSVEYELVSVENASDE